MFSSILALTSLLALASAKTINIAVGQNATLKFVPDTVTADVGDM
jgi:plastocyanin